MECRHAAAAFERAENQGGHAVVRRAGRSHQSQSDWQMVAATEPGIRRLNAAASDRARRDRPALANDLAPSRRQSGLRRSSSLMRLRRVETVPPPRAPPAQTPSLPFVRVIICAVLAALSAVPPLIPCGSRPRRCGCADHHGTGADRVFGSDGRTTNSLAQTTNSNVEERTSASVASAIAPRRCFSIASRRGRAPKRG